MNEQNQKPKKLGEQTRRPVLKEIRRNVTKLEIGTKLKERSQEYMRRIIELETVSAAFFLKVKQGQVYSGFNTRDLLHAHTNHCFFTQPCFPIRHKSVLKHHAGYCCFSLDSLTLMNKNVYSTKSEVLESKQKYLENW